MKKGRPPYEFDQNIADILCDRIRDGRSVRDICLDDDITVSRTTIYKWLDENEEFANQYARATEVRADSIFDEMFEIADNGANDWMEGQDGVEQYNGDHVQRSRLRIDTRKWALARMSPKKYGDKIGLDHSGGLTVTIDKDDADL